MNKKSKFKTMRMPLGVESFLTKIIWVGTYSVLFLTPLIIVRTLFYPFAGPRGIFFMGVIQIIFWAWLILAIHNSRYRPKINIVLILVSLFILSISLSAILGVNPLKSFWSNHERMGGILMFLHFFAFFLVNVSFFKKEKDWEKLILVSCLSASIVSLANVGEVLNIIEIAGSQSGSTIGNTSFMGTYLLLNVFLAFYIFLKSDRVLKIISGICFFLISLGLIFNERGRAALGSFAAGLILFFILWIVLNKKGILKWLAVLSLSGALIIGLVGFLTLTFYSHDISQNFLNKFDLGTIGGRTIIWDEAWQGFKERPLLGWGPENFEFAFYKFYNPCLGSERCGSDIRYDRAHNFLFDSLVSFGVVGTFLFFIIPIIIVFLLWQDYFKKRKTEFWEPGIITIIFGVYFVQGLTVFDMTVSYIMLFFIFALGSYFLQKDIPEKEIKTRKMNWAITGIITGLLIISFNSFVLAPFESSSNVLLVTRANHGTPEKLILQKRSLEKSPLGDFQTRVYLANDIINFTKSEDFGKILADSDFRENFFESFEFMADELEKSVEYCPLDYLSSLRLGQLYNAYFVALRREENTSSRTPENIKKSEEILDLAEKNILKAMELSPQNQSAYYDLAQNKIYRNQVDEAFSLAQEAIKLEPEILQSHLVAIRIASELLLDKELAERLVEEAREINPSWWY